MTAIIVSESHEGDLLPATNAIFADCETVLDVFSYIPGINVTLAPCRMGLAVVEAFVGIVYIFAGLVKIFESVFGERRVTNAEIAVLEFGCEYLCHAIGSGIKAAVQATPWGYVAILVNDFIIQARMLYYLDSFGAQIEPLRGSLFEPLKLSGRQMPRFV